MEVDGVIIPSTHKFPVEVTPEAHELGDTTVHIGQLVDSQIPSAIMRVADHQTDPHTMIIDGRDVSIDGAKLDTIETGAEVNNLTDQQAQSLTSGSNCSWHTHDLIYYRKTELSTSGLSQVNWNNIINTPATYLPSPHNHDDRYYTETELDNGQLNNLYYTESEIDSNFYTQTQLNNGQLNSLYYTETELDGGQLDNRYYTETEIDSNFYTKTELDSGQLDSRYYTETELSTSGQSQVNWDNITNKPSFGGNNWLEPALEKYVGSTAPSDTTNYNEGDRLIWYSGSNSNQHIYEVVSGAWTDVHTPAINDTIMVTDDGDGKPAQYWFNSTNWIKIADPDYADHGSLSGLSDDDHLQYLTENRHSLLPNNNPHQVTFTQTVTADSGTDITASEAESLTNGSDISLHIHDNRYYTETEIDSLLTNYSLIGHNHDGRYYTEVELDGGQLDNRYYTETEIDSLLTNYSLIGHNHDDRYYTESEIDSNFYTQTQLNNGQLNSLYYTETELDGGQLDNRYYTETEIDSNFYTKTELDSGQLNNLYYTETELSAIADSSSGADLIGATAVGSGTATTVQGILEELNISIASSANSLDEAYDNGGSGTGRLINADSGAVKIDTLSANNAPLELVSKSTAPTDNLAAGQIAIVNNMLYIYDGNRAKWLTPSKILELGHNNNADGKFLMWPGKMCDMNSGAKMIRNGTIVGISLQTSNSIENKNIYIKANGTNIFTFNTGANGNYSNSNLNIDFNANDFITVYVSCYGPPLFDPVLLIEISWRI